jgi:hypothetical protein
LLNKGTQSNNSVPAHIIEHYSSSIFNTDENCNFFDPISIPHAHTGKNRVGTPFYVDVAPGSEQIRSVAALRSMLAGAAGPSCLLAATPQLARCHFCATAMPTALSPREQ